jgi:hypothetical protein
LSMQYLNFNFFWNQWRASELLAGSDRWPNKSKLKFTVWLLQHGFYVCRQFKILVWPLHHGAFLFPWRSCVKDELVLYVSSVCARLCGCTCLYVFICKRRCRKGCKKRTGAEEAINAFVLGYPSCRRVGRDMA